MESSAALERDRKILLKAPYDSDRSEGPRAIAIDSTGKIVHGSRAVEIIEEYLGSRVIDASTIFSNFNISPVEPPL
jgi:hypothetical protein